MIKIYIIPYWDHWCGYRLMPGANDFCAGDDGPAQRVEVATQRLGLTLNDVEFITIDPVKTPKPAQFGRKKTSTR